MIKHPKTRQIGARRTKILKVSLGWKNKDGFSEEQIKTFVDEDAAFEFCKKHLDKIVRINSVRLRRDFEGDKDMTAIDDTLIRSAIAE